MTHQEKTRLIDVVITVDPDLIEQVHSSERISTGF